MTQTRRVVYWTPELCDDETTQLLACFKGYMSEHAVPQSPVSRAPTYFLCAVSPFGYQHRGHKVPDEVYEQACSQNGTVFVPPTWVRDWHTSIDGGTSFLKQWTEHWPTLQLCTVLPRPLALRLIAGNDQNTGPFNIILWYKTWAYRIASAVVEQVHKTGGLKYQQTADGMFGIVESVLSSYAPGPFDGLFKDGNSHYDPMCVRFGPTAGDHRFSFAAMFTD